MGNKDTTDAKSSMLYPMLLGGVSAFSILVIASFLVAMYKDKCCSRRHQRSNTYHKITDPRARKSAKIAYDIPMRSKAIISSVWQQEENDIADEVKRTYRNISDSSRPVLFTSGTGVFLQEVFDDRRNDFGFVGEEANQKAEETFRFPNVGPRNEGAKFNDGGFGKQTNPKAQKTNFGFQNASIRNVAAKFDDGGIGKGTKAMFENASLKKEGARIKDRGAKIRDIGAQPIAEQLESKYETPKAKGEDARNCSDESRHVPQYHGEDCNNKQDVINRDSEGVHCFEKAPLQHEVNEEFGDRGLGHEERNLDLRIPESTLTKVQDWVNKVNSSFRNVDVNDGHAREIGDGKKEAVSLRGRENMDDLERRLDMAGAVKSESKLSKIEKPLENYPEKEDSKGLSESRISESHEGTNAAFSTKNCIEKENLTVDTMNEKRDDPSKPKISKLKLTSIEDFQNASNVKNLILTRWVDHAAQQQQRKSGLVEEESLESENTRIGESSNELQYEEIDSVLTSVSRMDDKRIHKLKNTDFYKDLLLKSVRQRISENSEARSIGGKDGGNKAVRDNGTVSEDEPVQHDEAVRKVTAQTNISAATNRPVGGNNDGKERESVCNNTRKNKCSSSVLRPTARNAQFDNTIATRQSATPNQTPGDGENTRCSLSESSIDDETSESSEESTTCLEASTELGAKRASTINSAKLLHKNAVVVKYSVVRNFSNRFSPFVYVSLTHIHGLDRWIKTSSFFVRMYLANNKNSVEQSGLIASDSDVYIEEMFAVQGASTKDILNDSLVIEVVCKDEKEATGFVSLELKGLRYKATLLSTVEMKKFRGRLEG